MSKSKLEEIKSNIEYNRFGSKIALTESEYNYLIQQAERVQSLEYYKKDWMLVVEQNKRYREALEFYADEENYKPIDGIYLSSYQNKIDEDGGQTARKALEGEE